MSNISRSKHPGAVLIVSALALALPAFSTVKQLQPAITLDDPHPAEAKTLAHPGGVAGQGMNVRRFSRQKLNRPSPPEVFTLNIQRATTISAITASNDFHVTGGSCVEGRHYEARESCSVEVVFKPTGAGHRTGTLSVKDTVSVKPMLTPIGGDGYGPAVSFIPSVITTVPDTLVNGTGVLNNAHGLAIDGGDNIYIADTDNNLVRFIDSSGAMSIFAGGGSVDPSNYTATTENAKLTSPHGIATDPATGSVYLADTGNNRVYAIDVASDLVFPIEGGGAGPIYTCAPEAKCEPQDIVLPPPFNLAVTPDGQNMLTSFQSGTPPSGFSFLNQEFGPEGGQAYVEVTNDLNSHSNSPAIATDQAGDTFYAHGNPGAGQDFDPTGCKIFGENQAWAETVDFLSSDAKDWVVAGTSKCGFSGDGGKATGAEISDVIESFTFDAGGDFYFSDTGNNRVRRINAVNGTIQTLAGNGQSDFTGDNGPSTDAALWTPTGVATDSRGYTYALTTQDSTGDSVLRKFGGVGLVNFPDQAVSSSSDARTVLVSNSGNDALTFTHVGFTTGNTSDFSIDPDSTSCDFTKDLQSGRECYVGILFTPSATGNRSSVLKLLDNTTTGSNIIKVFGNGVAPAKAKLSPLSLTFASQGVGSSSASQQLTLSNIGGAPLTITSATFAGSNTGDYSDTTICGSILPAGGSCFYSVTFKPTATGTRTASFSIVTSAGTVAASVTGKGVTPAKLTVSPTSVSYSAYPVGKSSAAKTVTLTNSGGATLTFISFTFTGANPGDFSQTHTCGTTLAPDAKCTVAFVFKPTASGPRSASLSVVTSIGTTTIGITGSGKVTLVTPKVTLAAASNPAKKGQSIVFSSKLASTGSSSATGTVQLKDGSKVIAQAKLSSNTASFKVSTLSSGTHQLTAYYAGDSLHASAQSATLKQVVK